MSQAIYRKYRPQTFEDVINQYHITTTLKNQIASNTVAHAYVFAGPRGVGKTTVARLLAKAVNCENRKDGESEPCGECTQCKELGSGMAIDVIEIDAASHTGVENVRENIIEAVRFSPGKAKFKVFIIDEVHMLSTSAFNALLKTLEEPPAHAIFILATTELHKIPATILSRCQRFDFHRIATEDMVKRLQTLSTGEGVKVHNDVLMAISRLSEGCMRDAESLLGQVFALGEKEIGMNEASIILPVTNTATVVDLMDAVVKSDAKVIVEILNAFVDQGGSMKNLTDELIEFVRTMMLVSLEGPYGDQYDAQTMEKIRYYNASFLVVDCTRLLDALLHVKSRPYYDSLPQLPLELALIEARGSVGEIRADRTADQGGSREVKEVISTDVGQEVIDKSKEVQKEGVVIEAPVQKESIEVADDIVIATEPSSPVNKEDIALEDVQSKWQRCCEAVGKRSIALPLALQSSRPSKIEGNVVVVDFEKKFHFETFNTAKNIAILKDALAEVLQVEFDIQPVYGKEEEEAALGNLANEFGGKVVD